MTKIKPFKAVTYNQGEIKDLSRVVCPPYDVISKEAEQHYRDNNPYNLIHILLCKDIPGENKYRCAGNIFKQWLKDKILIQDERPAIYFYSQQYNLKGEKKVRLGFISLLRLEDNNQSVFGHEHTRLEPKEDRFRLLKQVKANLSPIFAAFLDKNRIIQRTYQQRVLNREPFIDITDDEKIIHKLWRLDDAETLNKIQASIQGENIFIADGHHRYEVACAYRDIMKRKLGKITGEEDFNYLLTYFTNTDYRGLSILPIHRLLKLNSAMDVKTFLASIANHFDFEEVEDKMRFFFMMEMGGRSEHVLGMYKDKKYLLLRLKNIKILDKEIRDKPEVYKSLDIAMLNHIILKKILGVDTEKKENLTFSPHADEFIARVDNNPFYVAFFLNPVKIEQIISVALNGERMPAKSTYFYPKVLSGLVINKFE